MATGVAEGLGECLQACPRMLWQLTAVCSRPGAEGERRSIITLPPSCLEQLRFLVTDEATATPKIHAMCCGNYVILFKLD